MAADEEMKKALTDFLKLFNIDAPLEVSEDEGANDVVGYGEVLSRTQKTLDEMQGKSDAILAKTGMTREQMDAYGANRDNFTDEQWQTLTQVRQATEAFKKEAEQFIGVENLKQKIEHEKALKTPGFGKKRRWISI